MNDEILTRPASSNRELEWLLFARDYRASRQAVVWNERQDFVMGLLGQLEARGGLTEKQWQHCISDYRIPAWRAHRRRLEVEAKKREFLERAEYYQKTRVYEPDYGSESFETHENDYIIPFG